MPHQQNMSTTHIKGFQVGIYVCPIICVQGAISNNQEI